MRLPWGNVPQTCFYCGTPGSRSIDDAGRKCHDRCLPTEQKRHRQRINREVEGMRRLLWIIMRNEGL